MTRRKFAFFAFSSDFSTRKAKHHATIKKTATEPPNRSERHCSAAGLPSAPPSAIPRPRIDSSVKEKAWPQRRAVWLPAILAALRPPSWLLLLDGATRPACSFFGRFGALFYTSTIPPRIRAR